MSDISSHASPTAAPADFDPSAAAELDAAARRVLERCDALAAFSEEPDRLTRRFATVALREAGEAVQGWMREAGMETRRDAIGNVIGRLEADENPPAPGASATAAG